MNLNLKTSDRPTSVVWARFRFSVVGALLSSPPARGELGTALQALAEKTWTHPVSGKELRVSAATMERWYYQARAQEDPVGVLRRAVRNDQGRVSLSAEQIAQLTRQHREHPTWSYQLHYDNLAAWVKAAENRGPLRSYGTVRRYMRTHGLVRRKRVRPKGIPREARASGGRENREVRSYESGYVGGLWHLDFHHGSVKVLTPDGQWQRPIALGILDDHTRLCCHLQWYLSETAEDLVHGLSQAIQKRGLPRALMTDNGPAMVAEEVTEGLLRLSIVHEKTLPYSPYQNGKQEAFWGTLEGRLLEMLDGLGQLTLEFLNQATQAWCEIEYNRAPHRELGSSPTERFARAPEVLRGSPSSDELRQAFRRDVTRRQRHSDGTISLEGKRFEIPSRFRHFRELTVRYARWDLGRVDLVDPRSGKRLASIHPLDRAANADGYRAPLEPDTSQTRADATSAEPVGDERRSSELPPLLKKILQDYSATGLPPTYLPKQPPAPPAHIEPRDSEPRDSEHTSSDTQHDTRNGARNDTRNDTHTSLPGDAS